MIGNDEMHPPKKKNWRIIALCYYILLNIRDELIVISVLHIMSSVLDQLDFLRIMTLSYRAAGVRASRSQAIPISRFMVSRREPIDDGMLKKEYGRNGFWHT